MTACSRKTGAKGGRDDLKTKAPHGLTQKSGWRTLNSCERRRQDGRSLDKRGAGRCSEPERMVLRPERNEARTSCPERFNTPAAVPCFPCTPVAVPYCPWRSVQIPSTG